MGARIMDGPQCVMLDENRLHLNHGPIDLIIECWGQGKKQGLVQATARFQTILEELVAELELLRQPLTVLPNDKVAKRMALAVAPFTQFVTPMAAVAGAVADEVLEALVKGLNLERAYVNNGGDIACYLSPGKTLAAAIPGLGKVDLDAKYPARGLATSGWRGRSHSLGIADAVTVVAQTAAQADVAATLIANATDLGGHPNISRTPANVLSPDSDLGTRLVTTGVGQLNPQEIAKALVSGRQVALEMLRNNQISAAALSLQDQRILVGSFPDISEKETDDARLQIA